MELFNAIEARRSVREFADEPVGRDVMEKIVAAAIEAPTGCNFQLKHYIIVDDPAVMDKLRSVSPAMKTAPAAIVLLVEPKATKYGEYWMQDASAAMQNMLLAAVGLGYAGCWIEGHVRPNEQRLREILSVPADMRVWAMTPVGKAAGNPQRPPKPALGEVLHYNRFGAKSKR